MATTKSRVVKIDPKKNSERTVSNSNTLQVEQPKWYPVDWTKVKNVSDIKVILENMGLGCFENAAAYDSLKKYLKND